jgi:hypothetical protein
MGSDKIEYTPPIDCRHCGKTVSMRILKRVSDMETQEVDGFGGYSSGMIYDLLKCPKCDEVSLQGGFYGDHMDSSDFQTETIYPPLKAGIPGLPPPVQMEYDAARAVAAISPNAFGVLIGRTLDAVCADRKAEGETLFARLNDLAKKHEIPAKLADMAHGLRQLRNVGAHADLGSLTAEEIPVLDALCTAVLEYVYKAPRLLALVEERLKNLKTKPATST